MEKPIIFKGDMVRAILDGRKTQTRRIAKLPAEWHKGRGAFKNNPHGDEEFVIHGDCGTKTMYCPRGRVGDRLWVREDWRCTGGGTDRNIIYRADGDSTMSYCGVDDGRTGILHVPEEHWAEWDRLVYKTNRGCNWRLPTHMPKWAARIWLEVTGVRVERVQDTIHGDMRKEGVKGILTGPGTQDCSYEKAFMKLWEWDKNPWVWVVEFKVINP